MVDISLPELKLKLNEKHENYMDLVRKLQELRNLKLIGAPNIFDSLSKLL